MQVRVAGHQVETSESLQAHVSERIEAIADKYFDRAIAANVTFGKGPYDDFTCEIVAPVPQGVVLKASGRAGEARIAFEGAADKIERQLSRYMKRLREHKGNGGGPVPEVVENAGYTIFAPAQAAEEPPAHPAIIAETRVDIPDATVSDAVMARVSTPACWSTRSTELSAASTRPNRLAVPPTRLPAVVVRK